MRTLLLCAAVLLLVACKKEQSRAVRYFATCNDCTVTYADESGGRQTLTVAIQWSKELTLEEGAPLFLEVCELDTPASFWPGASVFLDGANLAAFSNSQKLCGKVDAVVPER